MPKRLHLRELAMRSPNSAGAQNGKSAIGLSPPGGAMAGA